MTEPRKHLFDSDEEQDDDDQTPKQRRGGVTINRKFARDYQARKQQEELKQSRGDESDTEGSSSDTEDEAAELLTTELDVEILRTIQAVRNKDERIYDPQTRFFPHDDATNADKVVVRAKPKRYKDVVREQMLEQMEREEDGNDEDTDDEGDGRRDVSSRSHRLAYDATQMELRQAFLESAAQVDDEDDVMLVKKTKGRGARDDAEAQRLLEVEIEKLRQSVAPENDLVHHKGEVTDGQAFLLDFFKNRPWLERDESDDEDDDVDETVAMKGSKSAVKSRIDSDDASLEDLDQADDFEAAFNFRFEQATGDGTTALSGFEHSNVSYARGGNADPSLALPTLRRPDDSRKLQRQARNERKAAERKAKEEQLKRLKNAKRHEMNSKLRQIQAVMGQTDNEGTLDEDAIMKLLEGDFDPDQFETLMAATYNDDFYQQTDPEWTNDLAVRESLLQHKDVGDENDNDADVLVGPDNVDGGLYDNHEGDDDYEEEGDQEEDWEQEEWPEEEYDEEHDQEYDHDENDTDITKKVKAKINEELYKLDYEDIVAGMPTRFKYRQVTPNNYGLSTTEILCARDSTLKQFVSLKKLAPYAESEFHAGSRQRRRFRERLKQEMEEENEKIKASTATENEAEGEEEPVEEKKKRRRRLKKGSKRVEKDESPDETAIGAGDGEQTPTLKERDEPPVASSSTMQPVEDASSGMTQENGAAKRKRSKKKTNGEDKGASKRGKKVKKPKPVEGVSVSRLASYGF